MRQDEEPKTRIHARRTQVLYQFRANPFSRRYTVPGPHAPLAPTRSFSCPRPKKLPLPVRKRRRLTQSDHRPTNGLTNPLHQHREGALPRKQKWRKTPRKFSLSQKENSLRRRKGPSDTHIRSNIIPVPARDSLLGGRVLSCANEFEPWQGFSISLSLSHS